MREIVDEIMAFLREKKEVMILPLIIILVFLTLVFVLNRGMVNVPFVYSGF